MYKKKQVKYGIVCTVTLLTGAKWTLLKNSKKVEKKLYTKMVLNRNSTQSVLQEWTQWLLKMYIYRVISTIQNDTLYFGRMYRNYYCTRYLKYWKFLTGGSSKKIQEVSSSSIPDSTLTVKIFNTTFCVESLTVMVQIYQDAKNRVFT